MGFFFRIIQVAALSLLIACGGSVEEEVAGAPAADLAVAEDASRAALTPASSRPSIGEDVDVTREVLALKARPASCLSVVYGDVVVALDRNRVKRVTLGGKEHDIDVHYAKPMLANASVLPDQYGCFRVAESRGMNFGRIVLKEFEDGAAAVFTRGQMHPQRSVRIRYFGSDCGTMCGGGDISVSLAPNEEPFLSVLWWRS